MDFSDWSFEQQDFWGEFKAAILQKNAVAFDYYSSYSEKTHRRLRIKSEMAYRVLDEFAAVVDKQDADGNYIVTVCWPEDNWVYGTILSFGEYIEVLEPMHIREIIREKAKKIFEQYL